MKNTYFSGKCADSSVSTLLTPGYAARRFPASPSSVASICSGKMKDKTSDRAVFVLRNDFLINVVIS